MAESSRIEELRRRVQLDPASIAFAALAEEYRRAGRNDEAVSACRAGLQRHPAYLSARVTLGRALLEMGQYEEARTELEHVLRLAPENLAAIRGLADIHTRHGRRRENPDEETSIDAAAPETLVATPVAAAPMPTQKIPPVPISAVLPDPERATLSALENFLDAIARAKDAGRDRPFASALPANH